MKKLSFYEAVALLVGSSVGAGYLAIPYVVSQTGLWLGLGMIVAVGLLILTEYFAIAEITLRTEGKHQIAGYAGHYLGRHWKKVIEVIVILEAYGVLLAYLVAEGDVLAAVFGGSATIYSLIFYALAVTILSLGFKIIEEAELFLTLIMTLAVALIVIIGSPAVNFENYHNFHPHALLAAYGVIFFSFLAGSAIPEMRIALARQENKLAPAIIWGTVIPILVYVVFTLVIIGVTGIETTEVATIGLGNVLGKGVTIGGNLLAAITMTSAFIAYGLALKDTFRFDMRQSNIKSIFLTAAGPLLLFLFGIDSFIKILFFVGAVFGGLQGIIIIKTWREAKKRGDRQPEFVLGHTNMVSALLLLVFTLGIIYSFTQIG